MLRDLMPWNRSGRTTRQKRRRAARQVRRNNLRRDTELSVEWLEDRCMLAAGSLDVAGFSVGDADGINGVKIDQLVAGKDEEVQAVALQADGKLVVAGLTKLAGGAQRDFTVARYNTDGTRDTSFGSGGVTVLNLNAGDDSANDLVIDSLGRIVVVGKALDSGTESFAAVRLTSSGVLDTTFGGGDGIVTTRIFDALGGTFRPSEARSVALQSDGKIVLAGTVNKVSANGNSDFVVVRYDGSGIIDTSFDGDGIVMIDFGATPAAGSLDVAYDVAIQADGKIVVVGEVNPGTTRDFGVARLDANGSLDTTFDGDGKVSTDIGTNRRDVAQGISIEAGGKLVVSGFSANAANTVSDFAIARYNPADGSLDGTFNTGGSLAGTMRISFPFMSGALPLNYDFASALVIQPDGRYVIGGTISADPPDTGITSRFGLARANVNGTIDTTFGTGGYVQTAIAGTNSTVLNDLALQPDGKVVAVGWTNFTGGNQDVVLARYDLGLLIAEAGGPYAINEPGGSVVLNGSAIGDGPLTYEWDLDGDNIFGETGGAAAKGDELGQTPTFTATGVDGPTSFTVKLRVTDSTSFQAFDTATVNIMNVAPTLAISGASTVNEGDVYTLNLSSSDPGADTIASWQITWGDGNVETISGNPSSVTHTYADGLNNWVISATATDEDSTYAASSTVEVTVQNVAPTVAIAGASDVDEGSSYTLNLSSSDPGADAITSWEITWGDGNVETISGNPSSVTHTYADGLNNWIISATASDEDGTYAASSIVAVAVHNVAPVLAISGASDVDEGSSYTLNLSSFDPGTDTITQWTIDWGDSVEVVLGNPTSVTHTYADGSVSYTISATATDEDGTHTAGNTVALAVLNVAPLLALAGAGTVNEGSSYTLNLSSSDPGADTISQWTIDWGDSVEIVSGNPASVSHTYADGDANYTISATATDEDGTHAASNTVAVTVQNVAPTANAGGSYQTFDDTPITLHGTATDPAGALDLLTFSWDLDNNGSFETTGANATFDPVALGFTGTVTRTVQLRVNDGDGGVTTTSTTVQLLGQGTLLIDNVLYVVGSNTACDIVLITQVSSAIQVYATFNSNNPASFNVADVNEIQVRTRGGHDIVVTTPNVAKLMTIDGGSGNDLLTGGSGRNLMIGGLGNDVLYGSAGDDVLLGSAGNDDLIGGAGNDVLVGGNGNDILRGGTGRDLIIGSQDSDLLDGGTDEDILIGGYTIHDNNVAALDAVMATWGSGASFNARVATLTASGGLLQAGVAVFDDDDGDILLGGAGRDLVFGDNNPWDGAVDLMALQPLQDVLVAVT